MGDDEMKTNAVDQSSSTHEDGEKTHKRNEEEEEENRLQLGPMYSIKDHLEKDKDDESLRKWKEQLLGNVNVDGVEVDTTKEMIGTFSPQLETCTHQMPEETTPSGFFARGSYSAKTKFLDDDNKCYLEINYTFDIQKDWPSS